MRRMKREQHALKDIRRTTVEVRKSTSGGSTETSRLILVFDGGSGENGTPLTSALTSGGAAEKISPLINAWLAAAKN